MLIEIDPAHDRQANIAVAKSGAFISPAFFTLIHKVADIMEVMSDDGLIAVDSPVTDEMYEAAWRQRVDFLDRDGYVVEDDLYDLAERIVLAAYPQEVTS